MNSWIQLSTDILHEIFKFVLFHELINHENSFKQLLNRAHVNKQFRTIVQSSLTLTDSNYDFFKQTNFALFCASSPFQNIRESLIHVQLLSNDDSDQEIAISQALNVIILFENCINLKSLEAGNISITEFAKNLNPSRIICKLDRLDLGSLDLWDNDQSECKRRAEALLSIISIFKSLNETFTSSSHVCPCKAGTTYDNYYDFNGDKILLSRKCEFCLDKLPKVCNSCLLKIAKECDCLAYFGSDCGLVCAGSFACRKCCCKYCGQFLCKIYSSKCDSMILCKTCNQTACMDCTAKFEFTFCVNCFHGDCIECSESCNNLVCTKCSALECHDCTIFSLCEGCNENWCDKCLTEYSCANVDCSEKFCEKCVKNNCPTCAKFTCEGECSGNHECIDSWEKF